MTFAFFLGMGYDTVTLDFWVPLEKAQAFAARTSARTITQSNGWYL